MAWRLAKSLVVFRNELNAIAPNRSKRSDGTIGDAAHAASDSDHNENDAGVVCAFDGTHDPAGGADMAAITEFLRQHPPRALKYMIFNRRICSRKNGWRWVAYNGSNPHDKHAHFSTGEGPDGHSTGPYDDTSPWGLLDNQTIDGGIMLPTYGDSGPEVGYWQRMLISAGEKLPKYGVDEKFGNEMKSAILSWYKRHGGDPAKFDGKAVTAWTAKSLQEKVFGPSDAQVAAAVAAYLKANPPQLPASMTFTAGKLTGVKAAS